VVAITTVEDYRRSFFLPTEKIGGGRFLAGLYKIITGKRRDRPVEWARE
jgi:hypothetical protein